MKFEDAKKQIGTECTLSEMDNFFSPFNSNSIFNGDEGEKAIEELIREKKSNFSYVCEYGDASDGYCVEFSLVREDPDSMIYGSYANTVVKITDVWEH